MFNNKNDHNIHKFFHLSIATVLLIWFLYLLLL